MLMRKCLVTLVVILVLSSLASGDDRNKINNVTTLFSLSEFASGATATIARDIEQSDVLGVSWSMTSTQSVTMTLDFTYANDMTDTYAAASSQDGTVYTTRVTVTGASPRRGISDVVFPPCKAFSLLVTNGGTGKTTTTIRLFRQ